MTRPELSAREFMAAHSRWIEAIRRRRLRELELRERVLASLAAQLERTGKR